MKHPNEFDPVLDEQNTPVEDTSFGDILSQFEQEHKGETPGGPVEGVVVSVQDDAVFVDISRKTEGLIPSDRLRDQNGQMWVKPGDKILVNVTGRNEEGYYQLSTIKVEQPKDWSGLETAFAEQRVIGGVVTEVIKGGLRVEVGVKAFMPASRSGARDQAEMEKLVGQEIRCRITKLDVAREDVVVDRRSVQEEEERLAKQALFDAIQEGQVLRGTVRTLMDYGAFVDIGGVDGLLHVADISWSRIGKPADVLKMGDPVDVKVLKINPETKKISLGMKQLQPDPWTLAAQRYTPGDRVRGTVARLTDFGAFVNLEPGIDGLIHVSEMSWAKKHRKPSDVVSVGDAVDVVVLGVSPSEKRISLGLKQALGDPWEGIEDKFPIGSTVEGPITNIANFGAFIDLGSGIEGMIHVGDITREKRIEHPKDVLKQGQTVRAQVLEADRQKRRIRLGMKQLEPTSTDSFIAEHQPGDTITGRVVEVKQERAKIELGEGVFATCRLDEDAREESRPGADKPDLSTMTAMLAARWKQGGGSETGRKPATKSGEIRTFRIVALDPDQKRIQLELVG
jgi:small subunit ribosomal protein S1